MEQTSVVQIGEMKGPVSSTETSQFAFPPHQLIDKIGHGDAAVARELNSGGGYSLRRNRLASPVAGYAVVEKAVEIVQHRRRSTSRQAPADARHCVVSNCMRMVK